jgi:prophage regulatory protein
MSSLTHAPPTRGISTAEVSERAGRSRSSIYEMRDPKSPRYDPTLPIPFKSGRRTLFVEAEIESWLQSKIEGSRVRV